MTEELKPTCLLLGEAVVDFISGGIFNSLEDANSFNKFAGGEVANLAVNLARLGFSASLGTCVGTDGFGNFLRNHYKDAGVNLDLVQMTGNAPTTLIPICRQTETPDFSIYRGADQYLQVNKALLAAVKESRAIHTSAFALSRDPCRSTILTVLRSIQDSNKIISLDPNYHPNIWPDIADFISLLKNVFKLITITKPSLDDSTRIFGPGFQPIEYLEMFLELGPKIVILTLGSEGALLGTSQGERIHIHPSSISVIDVTGAGDAFWSGVIAGLLNGLPPLEAGRLGLTIAEYKIGILGPIMHPLPLSKYQKLAQTVRWSRVD